MVEVSAEQTAPAATRFILRFLCHNSSIGGIIGKGGDVIKNLREQTGASIRIGDYVGGCEERVVTIESDNGSTGKEALIRVLEQLGTVPGEHAKDQEGANAGSAGSAGVLPGTVRLLVWSAQIGCVIGKGGQVVNGLRSSTGAEIRILPKADVPLCASVKNDTVCQISPGHSSAGAGEVRCAVEEVAALLVANPVAEVPDDSHSAAAGAPRTGPLGAAAAAAAAYSGAGRYHPMHLGAPAAQFRMLVPAAKAGALIGRGGEVIQKVREETGATITVTQAGDKFRVVDFSSVDNPSVPFCAAQEALVRCFYSINEEEIPRSCSARLLIPRRDVGAIMGKGGATIKSIRQQSGAYIRIVEEDDETPEMTEPHELVTIEGAAAVVEEALRSITHRLCEAPQHQQHVQARARALAAQSLPAEERRSTTLTVAADQVGSIIGKAGANIKQIRMISEAAVKLHDADPATRLHKLEIVGTAQQCAAAESMVQAFLAKAGAGPAVEQKPSGRGTSRLVTLED